MADGRDQDPGSSTPEGDEPEADATPDTPGPDEVEPAAGGAPDAQDPDLEDPDPEHPDADDTPDEPDEIDLSEYEAEFAARGAADESVDEAAAELDSNGELVAVGAAAAAPSKRSTAKKGTTEKKGRATPRRDAAHEHQRTGPVTFVKESIAELRKVVYPTGPQLLNYFVVVLIFVLFIIAIVSLLDLAFGWLVFKVFA